MRRALLPLLAVVLTLGGCASDELATEVFVAADFDATACRIIESNPAYAITETGDIDLLTAAPDAAMTFVVTNRSNVDITGLVNRYDPTLTPQEALSMERALEESGRTMNEPPGFIVGPAFTDFAAEARSIGDNQIQSHYRLQPGLSVTLVYSQFDAWYCHTSAPTLSLIEVPAADPTND